MQRDLVCLGFLADRDRGNTDAITEATVRLIHDGANLFKDLDALFASLREAKCRFDAQDDTGRQGALHGLDADFALPDALPDRACRKPAHAAGLAVRRFGIADGGQVGPMVAPVKKRGGARANSFYNALKGIAVFITFRLEASDMTRRDARIAVAKELANMGVRPARKGSREGSGEFSARTIGKWQEDINADVGFRTTAAQEFRQCEADNVPRVLEGCGLSSLPEGSTADDLELSSRRSR